MHSFNSLLRPHRLVGFGFAVGMALVGPMGPAWAQGAGAPARTLEASDQSFVAEAAQGGMAEVAMGKMAQQRATHAQVKTFGERMVRDHSKANEDLKQVASAKAVTLPTTPGTANQHHADALGKLSGAEFDRAYMKHMVDDHKKDVANFEKAAASAKDPDVKAFAVRTLPTLKAHRELAQTTYDAVK